MDDDNSSLEVQVALRNSWVILPGTHMSRYRSEVHTLRARIRELEFRLDALDRLEGSGKYATSLFAHAMYQLGRKVGRLLRRGRRERASASELERLRARAQQLEQRLEQRTTGHG